MKWFKWLLIGIAALLLLFAAVSLALASQFRGARSVATAAPAEEAYPPLAWPAGSKRWIEWHRRDAAMHFEYGRPDCRAGLNSLKRRAGTA